MKRRRFFALALFFIVPLALYFYIAERNSWRPKTIDLNGVRPQRLSFSPDGRYVLVTATLENSLGSILVCDISQRRITQTLKGYIYPLFLKGGSYIMVITNTLNNPNGGQLHVFSFPDLQPIQKHPFQGITSTNSSPLVWPDDHTLAAQDVDGNVWLWDFDTDQSQKVDLRLPQAPSNWLYEVSFLADKKTLYVTPAQLREDFSTRHKDGKFWDFQSKRERFSLNKNDYQIFSSSTNGLCLFRHTKEELEIWNYLQGQKLTTLKNIGSIVYLSPDGAWLVTQNGYITELRDTVRWQIARTIETRSLGVTSSVFTPDNKTLAVWGDDSITLWRVK